MPIPKERFAALEIKSALRGNRFPSRMPISPLGSGGYGYDLIGAAALLRLETPWTDQLPATEVRHRPDGSVVGVHALNGRWNAGSNVSGTAEEGKRGGKSVGPVPSAPPLSEPCS